MAVVARCGFFVALAAAMFSCADEGVKCVNGEPSEEMDGKRCEVENEFCPPYDDSESEEYDSCENNDEYGNYLECECVEHRWECGIIACDPWGYDDAGFDAGIFGGKEAGADSGKDTGVDSATDDAS